MATNQITGATGGTGGVIKPGVDTFYNRTLLSRCLPALIHAQLGDKKPFKAKNGNNMKFRRWKSLAVAESPVPLVEGVPGTGQALEYEEYSVTIQHYGGYVIITDEVDTLVEDPVLTEAAMLLGEQAGLTVDRIYREVLNSGNSCYRCAPNPTSDPRNAVNSKITSASMEIALRTLRRNNIKKWTRGINASTGVGTAPVRAAYWAITHPDLIRDLESLPDFVHVSKYASQTGVDPNEIGSWKDIRILCTSNAKVWNPANCPTLPVNQQSGAAVGATGLYSTDHTNIDVYSLLIIGQEAYGICPLGSDNAKNIRKGFTEGGPSNPLEQIATSGWSVWTCAVRLNEQAIYRIECGATA